MTSHRHRDLDRHRHFALVVTRHRHAAGLTIGRLADLARCNWSSVKRIEYAKGSPSLQLAWNVADALDVPLEQLLEETTASLYRERARQQRGVA